ncbi:MAG: CpaF family protein [Lachnospiraceae bacterium]|nr:CpaF family protein [Lachnospiraceae bacterium]
MEREVTKETRRNDRQELRDAVYAAIDFSHDTSDEEIYALIDAKMAAGERMRRLTIAERRKLRREVFAEIRELDVLQALLDDPEVTEIMVNGPEQIFIERAGRLQKYDARFSGVERLGDVIQRIVASCNRTVNEASPIVDARLKGARVNVVLKPVALNGPILTIRRFPQKRIDMEALIAYGAVSPFLAAWLNVMVKAGYNIFVSGGTGSGKTTFLNALSDAIPADARVITIEDSAELQITHVENLVSLEVRAAGMTDCREITIRDLIKASLRMRPDRIVVGEVRGEEAIDMIQAMNTGHDGSMSTGHANSTKDMLHRLETMILMGMEIPLAAVRGQLAAGIDLIVHLGRLRDHSRKVLEIAEVTGRTEAGTGEIETRTLYRFRETGYDEKEQITGVWTREAPLEKTGKLKAAGLALPADKA